MKMIDRILKKDYDEKKMIKFFGHKLFFFSK